MRLALSIATLLILLGLTGGSWHLWSTETAALIPSGKYVVACAALIGAIGLLYTILIERKRPTVTDLTDLAVWSLGLVLIFFSAWLCRPYSFYQGPAIRVTLVIGACVALALSYTCWKRVFIILPLLASAFGIWSFFKESGGALLFADDHAMFFFRLKLLKENFPAIPFWSPLWNGGIDARDFFATGALNAFLLASPLVYAFPVESVYNVIIAGILWVFTPLCSYVAARKFGGDRVVAAISALLSTCSSLFWYRWGLKYGTVGFVVSSSLIPLVMALFMRFISQTGATGRERFLLIAASSLMLLWSPSGIALIPLALFAIPKIPTIATSRKHLLVVACIIAINLPWMMMMWKVSGVGRFLNSEGSKKVTHVTTQAEEAKSPAPPTSTKTYRHAPGGIDLRKSLKNWQETAGSTSPLVVVLAIPAIFALGRGRRAVFGAACGWLLFLGTIGVSLKPQLELDRMLVIAGLLVSFPLAHLIVAIFRDSQMNWWRRGVASIVGGFMLTGPFATSDMLRNRLYDKYTFAGPEVAALSSAIETHAYGGRALFTGCVLHQLSGGHLAPLAMWARTPLIATSYAHNIWTYEQPIPPSFLAEGDAGIKRFFDLMNVTVVLAHEPTWRRYLAERPSEYSEEVRHGEFILYKRIGTLQSYILEGEAKNVVQDSNSVALTPLTERVVLKFKHYPFLTTTEPGCTLRPYAVAPELTLIELSGCPIGKPVEVKSISPYRRLVG